MTEPALSVEGLVAAYGKHEVLHGVSLHAKRGEIFGLIGLNGQGKTTMIKSVVDLGRPKSGEIRIFGKGWREKGARENLAYLPEQFLPSPYLTGAEFIRLSLSWFGMGFDRARALELAERLALSPKALDRRATTWSKGMGQKIGLIGTLMTERPLLILDEPMSGLDPLARLRLKELLVEYRAAGRTVFLSSHILADLDELCDRVAVLNAGRIVYEGPPAELRDAQGGVTLERAFLQAIAA